MAERIHIGQITVNVHFHFSSNKEGGRQPGVEDPVMNKPFTPRVRRRRPETHFRRERRPIPKNTHIPPEFLEPLCHSVQSEFSAMDPTVAEPDPLDMCRDMEYVPPNVALNKVMKIHGMSELILAEAVTQKLMDEAEVASPRVHPDWDTYVSRVHRALFPKENKRTMV